MKATEALEIARAIALSAKLGNISYDEAKERCKEYLAIANKHGKTIANKYNKRYRPVSFTALIRQ